ncbi:OsmC family protein [Streptomyces boninensis]|uniref:OsmC family protein n=1 Tax=Streptomyces boninensis TaxID=2039455 RepID=UPI003B20FC65
MARTHTYETTTVWTGNRGTGTSGYRDFDRLLESTAAGIPPLPASSDPAFRGDPSRWNPELLLAASLAQCHMLWYLHLCSVGGVVVTSYRDATVGTMTEAADGGGQFTEVILRPEVTVSDPSMVDKALELHAPAHEKCFIARSVNFPVRHEPQVTAE